MACVTWGPVREESPASGTKFFMACNRDPLGYYAALGLDPSASTGEVKRAFKARAQQLHPDRNHSREATVKFQFLNQAHQVLSDSSHRSEYDASSCLSKEDADIQKPASAPVTPIVCCVCGKVSAQPRYVIYRYVVSFVVATRRSGHQGVFCAGCGAKRAYKDSLITWILGWWGVHWGPIYSAQALVHNMLGGEQPALSNFKVLGLQAAHFASNDRMDLARQLADQALELSIKIPAFRKGQESAADRDLKRMLAAIQSTTQAPTRSFKRSWGTGSASFRLQASAIGLVAVAMLAALVSGARANRTAHRYAAPTDIATTTEPAKTAIPPGSRGFQLETSLAPTGKAADTAQNDPTNERLGSTAFDQPIQPLPRTGQVYTIRNSRAHDTIAPLKVMLKGLR